MPVTTTANYTIIGDGNVVFGTDDVGYTTIGQIQSAGKKTLNEVLELKNRYGNTFVVILFDGRKEMDIESIFDADYTIPANGDLIDIFGETNCIAMDTEEMWANGKEKRIKHTIKLWDGVNAG